MKVKYSRIDTSDLNAAVVKCVDNQLFQIKYSIMVGEVFKGRYRMYLLNITLTSENTSTCITFVCSDGVVRKDISWLESYSAKVCEVSGRSCDRCGDCVFLFKHTEELHHVGHTVVGTLVDRQQVLPAGGSGLQCYIEDRATSGFYSVLPLYSCNVIYYNMI